MDPFLWRGLEPRFDHNIAVSGSGAKVIKIKARSEEALGALAENSFDAAYIDGSHRAPNVMLDAVLSWKLVKPGGLLIFDDYKWAPELPPHERPKMAIDAFLNVLQAQLEVLHIGYQVIVRKPLSPRTIGAAARSRDREPS